MKGLSKKEVEIISDLEFRRKYYFTRGNIASHFKNKKQLINTIYNLAKKGRIIRLSKNKYFLIPIKARTGKWTDDPFILIDEICDGENYFIGGWAAANYWRLTEQIPMQTDVYTTRRQGKFGILNNRIVFHRTTKKNLEKSVTKNSGRHSFRILSKEASKVWMKSRK